MAILESIDELTAERFSEILRQHRSDPGTVPRIQRISTAKVDQGVLSDVYKILVEYHNSSSNDIQGLPKHWLAKFCRPDLDLSWMCRNENIFYSQVAPKLLIENTNLPFRIPKFLSGSDKHLVLEEETEIHTYPLQEGCPTDKIQFLLESLAAWHALGWNSEILLETNLTFPTGMGQRLHPLQKEGLFVSSWRAMVDSMESNNCEELTKLCETMEGLKLRDIHDKVHQHRVTCVHGDYHIANWLFPTHSKPVLVDFATTGYGNPMVDLVFFLVVSTDDDTVSSSKKILEEYHRLLLLKNNSLPITMESLQEWFPWAVLGQFLILVAYDGLCKAIAKSETDPHKRKSQLQHFANVNRRMGLLLQSIDKDCLSQLEPTTFAQQTEARLFCQTTPLTI